MITLNMYIATVSGLMMLTFCSDMLVTGATHIGRLLRLSAVFVGVVIVGFGTSLPEILTTLISGMRGEGALGVGNIVGSNIANIGLILGTALILFGATRMKTAYARNGLEPLVHHCCYLGLCFGCSVTYFIGRHVRRIALPLK